jgi:hypothetical protein
MTLTPLRSFVRMRRNDVEATRYSKHIRARRPHLGWRTSCGEASSHRGLVRPHVSVASGDRRQRQKPSLVSTGRTSRRVQLFGDRHRYQCHEVAVNYIYDRVPSSQAMCTCCCEYSVQRRKYWALSTGSATAVNSASLHERVHRYRCSAVHILNIVDDDDTIESVRYEVWTSV